jgi:class 3 adenylate cyclase/predicted ATPase
VIAPVQVLPAAGIAQVPPPIVSPSRPPIEPPPTREAERVELPKTPRSISIMLPSLGHYLPDNLYEPLERRPNERHVAEVRDHLVALLHTTKTYLPWPVIVAPQPGGVPAGGMEQGTFLLADMSGFTALSERLSRFGQSGAEQITEIINNLFHEMVSILFAYGGTLLKFGGDALLGLFMADSDESLAASARHAMQAALAMQKGMEKFIAIKAGDETYALRLKCGISSGRYFAAHIGTPENMSYVTTGHTVNRSDQAQSYAEPGDIIIAQSVLDLAGQGIHVEPRDEGFYVLRGATLPDDMVTPITLDEKLSGDLNTQIDTLVDRLDRLSPYLPGELLPRIATNPTDAQIAPDHRPVTVMFVNYVGISDLIEDLGDSQPDIITQHLNTYFSRMSDIVDRYEGTVARMDQYTVGDRLVVFFGAPRAHEDDPVRAVYTALEMQQAISEEFTALQASVGVYRFRQRIGINTGQLFAGNVGAANLRQEYTLMGDDINMSARLMSKAGWDQIFVTKKTRDRVAAFIDLQSEGELKVKGKEILIPTYRVLGRRGEIGRTRGLDSGDSPYTGRISEFEIAQKCGEGLLKERGQIVSIYAESGMGKSRIMREFKTWLLARPGAERILWLEGRALSFSEHASYWLIIQMIRGILNLKQDATEDDVLYTLWERGEELLGKETAREAIPFIANIMGLKLEGEWVGWVHNLSPEVRQKQTFWSVQEFFKAATEQYLTVIALDDLHWADEASLALIDSLMQVAVQAPLMFLLAFRPQRDKGCWRLRDKAVSEYPHRHTEIPLKPLMTDESDALLSKLLPGAQLTTESRLDILNKASGNPFYLEEVVRTLIENGAVIPHPQQTGSWQVTEKIAEVDVPDSLEGAIIARIDRLSEAARQALQMASVIGRSFEMPILDHLVEAQTELGEWLAQLERDDLIRPAGTSGYIFPNALVQEVVYDNLPVHRRQEYHRRVGEALEAMIRERYGDDTPDNLAMDLDGDGIPEQGSELLAYHYHLSDNRNKAMLYLELAGYKAQTQFANETAIQYYTDLLAFIHNDETLWEKHYEILERRQQIYKLRGMQSERQADIDRMMELAIAHNDQTRRATALQKLADFYDTTSQYDQAEATANEALALWIEVGNQEGQADILYQLGVLAYYQGDYNKSRPLLEQATALQQAIQDIEAEAWSEMYIGMIDLVTGCYSDARHHHEHALELALQRKDGLQMGIHLTNAARVALRLGRYEQALDMFKQALEMKVRVGDRMGQGFAHFGMGRSYLHLGRYDEAETAYETSLAIRQQIRDERGVSYCWHDMGQLALEQGHLNQAKTFFQQAYETRSRLKIKAEAIEDLSWLGQVYLAGGKVEQAFRVSDHAVALLDEQKDIPGEEHEILLNHFRILKAMTDPSAGEWLQRTYNLMLDQADRITDAADREAFLSAIALNQQILAEVDSGEWTIQKRDTAPSQD